MEAFSLLKFWKSSTVSSANPLPTVQTAAAADDGPFFDLEFSASDEEDDVAEVVCEHVEVLEETETEDGSRPYPNPEEEDEFKILAVNPDDSGKPEVFPVSLLRSATKLRILMSGFKRSSKPEQPRPDPKNPQRRKLFTIKFKPGEVPIVSLFTRDNSSSRPLNGVVSTFSSSSSTSSTSSSSSSEKPNADADEKLNPKEKVNKYIKMVKPLYIRVSKKYGEKLGLSGQLRPEKEEEAVEKKNPGSGVGLKVLIQKRLSGKMKSPETAAVAGKHQDDLVQQHEWIQGAILHCKRSFNASRGENEEKVEDTTVNDVV